MRSFKVFCLIVLFSLVTVSNSANIIAFFPSWGKSHLILASAILKELGRRNHDVTLVSPIPFKVDTPNYTNILMKNTFVEFEKFLSTFRKPQDKKEEKTFDILKTRDEMTQTKLIAFLPILGNVMVQAIVNDPELKHQLLNPNKTYDLVIVENFNADALLGFGRHYSAPVITFETVAPTHLTNRQTGNHNPYSWIPEKWLDYTDKMNLFQRAHNFFMGICVDLYFSYSFSEQERLFRELFPKISSEVSLQSLLTEVSLALTNSYHSLSFPRALPPNIIEIGGFHVAPPKKLPKDLQDFMDQAKDGVIYFSLGSNVNSSSLPPSMLEGIFKSLGKLKQKVLWKWEDDSMDNIPNNVKTSKWLPQSDILAHPNIRMFITHGGLLSQTEAIDRGVPLIGIPLFSDQFLNTKRAETVGFGITLAFENITETSFTWAINEILQNPKYKEIAKYQSDLLHDQPTKPLDRAIYWIEYVIRHKGAKFLKSAATELNFFQRYLIDVAAVSLIILGAVIYILYLLVKISWRVYRNLFLRLCRIDTVKEKTL